MLRANGLVTKRGIVDDNNPLEDVRSDLIENLRRPNDYVIVGYKRSAFGQPGGGHISPVGAYDEASDSFLVLDVNPANAGWVWIPPPLWSGACAFDTVENRGYILVGAQ